MGGKVDFLRRRQAEPAKHREHPKRGRGMEKGELAARNGEKRQETREELKKGGEACKDVGGQGGGRKR